MVSLDGNRTNELRNERIKEEAADVRHRVDHGSVRVREGFRQWPGAGSTRNGRRKRVAHAAAHLPLDVDDR